MMTKAFYCEHIEDLQRQLAIINAGGMDIKHAFMVPGIEHGSASVLLIVDDPSSFPARAVERFPARVFVMLTDDEYDKFVDAKIEHFGIAEFSVYDVDLMTMQHSGVPANHRGVRIRRVAVELEYLSDVLAVIDRTVATFTMVEHKADQVFVYPVY